MTAPDRIAELIDKYLENDLTQSEEQELQQQMQQSPVVRVLVEELGGAQRLPGYQAFPGPVDEAYYRNRVIAQAMADKRRVRRNQAFTLAKIAAALIMALLVVWMYRSKATTVPPNELVANWESFLLLPDSSKLLLDKLPADTLLAGGLRIRKDGNELSYSISANAEGTTLHRLYVERGEHYLLMLPDSSRISVSDSTAVNFPVPFDKQERSVAVSGQARFEVQPLKGAPFKAVLVSNALDNHPHPLWYAEARGTAFSVRAYPGEATQTVQLDEGKLLVQQSPQDTVQLSGGQQVTWRAGSKLKKENFTASGNSTDRAAGRFLYYNTDLHTIMQDIGRWYGVKVSYTGASRTKKITLSAYSTQSLNEIIKMISRNDIKVSRKGQEIHVKVTATSS